ncbi:MAG: hypothetical protein AAFY88_17135, partial [Acidobacteriota bacterium]
EPVEFGSVPLYSSDPIKHSNKGAVGAIIIEPQGAEWREYPDSRAKAYVDPTPRSARGDEFREFVLIVHDDLNLRAENERTGNGSPLRPLPVNDDPTETGQVAFNYKTEPVWFRHGFLPETDPGVTRQMQMAETFSNTQIGNIDPFTPVFRAVKGDNVRFRLVHPGGDTQQHTWGLHGHVWQETPWFKNSTVQGDNPASEWKGVEFGHGPTNAFNVLVENGAGGAFQITGDYMYRDYVPWYLSNGLWGIFRVFESEEKLREEEPKWVPNAIGPAGSTASDDVTPGLKLAEPTDLAGGDARD